MTSQQLMLSPSSSKIDMVITSPKTNRSLTKQNSDGEVNSPKPWSKDTQSPGQIFGNKKVIHDPTMISPVLTGVKESDSENGKQKLDLNLNERSAVSIRDDHTLLDAPNTATRMTATKIS